MSEEISVKPEELFADLTKLVAKVEGLPDGASQCVAAPPYGDSVAGFGEQYDWFLADLAKAVRATKQTIAAAGAQIREAVVMLAAQDEALKAEADAVVGMLDAVLPPIPARAALGPPIRRTRSLPVRLPPTLRPRRALPRAPHGESESNRPSSDRCSRARGSGFGRRRARGRR